MIRRFFFAVLLFSAPCLWAESSPKANPTFRLNSRSFKILKDQTLSGQKSQRSIEAQNAKAERVEIRIVSPLTPEAAQALIESEQKAVRKLYAAPQTPYLGDIAQAIGGCATKFGPVVGEVRFLAKNHAAVVGAATADHVFGACSVPEAKFKGGYVGYYDPDTKSVWTWRIFAPWLDKKPLNTAWLNEVLVQFQE